MEMKPDAMITFRAMTEQLLLDYRRSGLRHHDLPAPFTRGRRVDLGKLFESALASGHLTLRCPVCGEPLAATAGRPATRGRRFLRAITPIRPRSRLYCRNCHLDVRRDEPLFDTVEYLCATVDRCRDAAMPLPSTQAVLDAQYDAWKQDVERKPAPLKRSLVQPFVPFASSQYRNLKEAMVHAYHMLVSPDSLGLDYADLQRAVGQFTGRNTSRHENLFSYLEAMKVVTPLGGFSRDLLRDVMLRLRRLDPLT